MRFPYRGAGVVLICNGRVLAGQRAKRPFINRWSIPGGSREKGESEIDAALRELREETGIVISDPSDCFGKWTLRIPFFSWTSFFFRTDREQELRPDEFTSLCWMAPEELGKKKLRPFMRSELKKAFSSN